MKRKLLKALALFLLTLLPFAAFLCVSEALPDPYRETYLSVLDEKYNRLAESEGKRIVLIGGSSLPFALRSDLLEQELDGNYTVVNFGLYATLGTKVMMDLAQNELREGDIVILAPELNEQTYSLYFNAETLLQATNGFDACLASLPVRDKLSLFYHAFPYGLDKLSYAVSGKTAAVSGIYAKSSFNAYGDIAAERKNNIMNNGYDANMTVSVDDTLLNEDFLAYVNDYAARLEEKGVTLYFNYSPVNAKAIRTSKASREAFEARLCEALDCKLLGTIEDYLIDERYFYDTNFHLNSSGAVYYTRQLALTLKETLGLASSVSLEIPEPPALAEDATVTVPTGPSVSFEDYNGEPNNDYLDYFLYEWNGSSYEIVGVKEAYLSMKEVILPSVYEGKNITAVSENAFYGCTELLHIHIGTTYKSLAASAFNGCIALKGIWLYQTDGNLITPPPEGLLDGASREVKLYIPENGNYVTGYTWSRYEDDFQTFSKEDSAS